MTVPGDTVIHEHCFPEGCLFIVGRVRVQALRTGRKVETRSVPVRSRTRQKLVSTDAEARAAVRTDRTAMRYPARAQS